MATTAVLPPGMAPVLAHELGLDARGKRLDQRLGKSRIGGARLRAESVPEITRTPMRKPCSRPTMRARSSAS